MTTEDKKVYRKISVLFCNALVIASFCLPARRDRVHQSPPAQPDQWQNASPDDSTNKKISSQGAAELAVDQPLKFASKDSGLPIKHEIKRRLTNREEVVAYLEKSMRDDKSAQRVQRSELVLKKFGLLPRDFKLSPFLVALLREQIAGYYDPKTKTMNLLDCSLEQQRPVLAHELTQCPARSILQPGKVDEKGRRRH